MPASRLSTTAFPPGGSTPPCTEIIISSGPLHTSGSASSLPSSSRSHPATCTSHTTLSSTPTTLKSCDGPRGLIHIETSPRIRIWVNSVVSSLPRGQVDRRRWDLRPHRDLRLTASDRGSRLCELLVEPICRPVSGRLIVGSILRPKKVDRLSVVYRVTCLHLDRARRTYITGWGIKRNRKYRLPTYEILSRGGDPALHQRRATTGTDLFHSRLFTLPVFLR